MLRRRSFRSVGATDGAVTTVGEAFRLNEKTPPLGGVFVGFNAKVFSILPKSIIQNGIFENTFAPWEGILTLAARQLRAVTSA